MTAPDQTHFASWAKELEASARPTRRAAEAREAWARMAPSLSVSPNRRESGSESSPLQDDTRDLPHPRGSRNPPLREALRRAELNDVRAARIAGNHCPTPLKTMGSPRRTLLFYLPFARCYHPSTSRGNGESANPWGKDMSDFERGMKDRIEMELIQVKQEILAVRQELRSEELSGTGDNTPLTERGGCRSTAGSPSWP